MLCTLFILASDRICMCSKSWQPEDIDCATKGPVPPNGPAEGPLARSIFFWMSIRVAYQTLQHGTEAQAQRGWLCAKAQEG